MSVMNKPSENSSEEILDHSDRNTSIENDEKDENNGNPSIADSQELKNNLINNHVEELQDEFFPDEPKAFDVVEEEEDVESKQKTEVNYASADAGAVILADCENCKNFPNLLIRSKDKYAIAPCENKIWFIVQLSEDIQLRRIVIANYEQYSSTVDQFQLFGSHTYPTKAWQNIGTFKAHFQQGDQRFDLVQPAYVRYLKFQVLSSYGSEYYCTLTSFRVHGSTIVESIHEEFEDYEKVIDEVVEESYTNQDVPGEKLQIGQDIDDEKETETGDDKNEHESKIVHSNEQDLDSTPTDKNFNESESVIFKTLQETPEKIDDFIPEDNNSSGAPLEGKFMEDDQLVHVQASDLNIPGTPSNLSKHTESPNVSDNGPSTLDKEESSHTLASPKEVEQLSLTTETLGDDRIATDILSPREESVDQESMISSQSNGFDEQQENKKASSPLNAHQSHSQERAETANESIMDSEKSQIDPACNDSFEQQDEFLSISSAHEPLAVIEPREMHNLSANVLQSLTSNESTGNTSLASPSSLDPSAKVESSFTASRILSDQYPCLKQLNFTEFKEGMRNRVNMPVDNPKMSTGQFESIFKTLMTKLRNLEVNQVMYESYIQRLQICYNEILLSTTQERQGPAVSQEDFQKLTEQVQALYSHVLSGSSLSYSTKLMTLQRKLGFVEDRLVVSASAWLLSLLSLTIVLFMCCHRGTTSRKTHRR